MTTAEPLEVNPIGSSVPTPPSHDAVLPFHFATGNRTESITENREVAEIPVTQPTESTTSELNLDLNLEPEIFEPFFGLNSSNTTIQIDSSSSKMENIQTILMPNPIPFSPSLDDFPAEASIHPFSNELDSRVQTTELPEPEILPKPNRLNYNIDTLLGAEIKNGNQSSSNFVLIGRLV